MSQIEAFYPRKGIDMYSSYHSSANRPSTWHPCASKFDRSRSVAKQAASEAIRYGDELRERLRGRRILESV